MNTIPSIEGRDFNSDVATISKALVKDVVSGEGRVNTHLIETTDLLVLWVTEKLGLKFYVNWGESTDEECQKATPWYDYCEKVFNACGE